MQRYQWLCLILVVGGVGCEREPAEEAMDVQPVDTLSAETTPADATISLADIAGTWDMRSVPEAGADTTATVYQIQVRADSWIYHLPDRDPIEASVTTSGDSIVVDAGPFESVRREGVMVTTHSVFRLDGGRLAGTTVAHYETSGPDSLLTLRVEGTRAP